MTRGKWTRMGEGMSGSLSSLGALEKRGEARACFAHATLVFAP